MGINEQFSLAGKVAIVTGGGKGIGQQIGITLAAQGAAVVFAARTQADLDANVATVQAAGGRAHAIACDVANTDDIERLVKETVAAFGGIDIVINNAGGANPNSFEKTTADDFRYALDFNIVTAFSLSRAALPYLRERQGSIVNIASMAARLSQPNYVAYGTAKAGLIQMTKLMAAELAPAVRVNAVSPGPIMTDALMTWIPEAYREKMRQDTPLKSLGEPTDIANAVLFLVSPAARWISGKDLQVDGGTENASQ